MIFKRSIWYKNDVFVNFHIIVTKRLTFPKINSIIPKNSQNTAVNDYKCTAKLYACIYWGKLLKVNYHYRLILHKNEEEIKKLFSLPEVRRNKGKIISKAARACLIIISRERTMRNFKFNLKATTKEIAITINQLQLINKVEH